MRNYTAGIRARASVFVFLLTSLIVCCGGLPRDFESLPLQEKVAAYEEYWRRGGGRDLDALYYIAWHGWDAADLMAQYLTGERSGIPKREAIDIILLVQWRGCSLQGTAAEAALTDFLASGPRDPLERDPAETVLAAIREDQSFPSQAEVFPGGPCQEGREVPEGGD